MYKKKQAQTVFDQINITPLTDVFLVLLVVLMLITPIMDEASLKVSAPGNGDKCGKVKATQIVVDIDAVGQMKLNGQIMRFTDSLYLQRQLQKIKEKSTSKEYAVLIRPDENSKHGDVVAVMDAATGAGIAQVGVQAPPKKSTPN